MARGLIVLLVAAAGVNAAGCAADPTLAPDSVVEGLAEVLFPADDGVPEAIECPAPDPELIAQALTCTALLHGEPITIDVTIDETGASIASVRERLLDLAVVSDDLATRLAADLGIRPEVDCPGLFVVDRPGIGFECTAVHDGRPLVFDVDIIDENSNWAVTLQP